MLTSRDRDKRYQGLLQDVRGRQLEGVQKGILLQLGSNFWPGWPALQCWDGLPTGATTTRIRNSLFVSSVRRGKRYDLTAPGFDKGGPHARSQRRLAQSPSRTLTIFFRVVPVIAPCKMNKLGLLLIAATAWGGQGHLRPSSKVEGAPVTADSEGGPMTTNLRPHATLEAFDYFLLELQWGITLCSDGTFNCESEGSPRPRRVVHGAPAQIECSIIRQRGPTLISLNYPPMGPKK